MLDGSCSESSGRVVSHYRMERHVPENIVGVKEWTTTPPDDFLDALVGKVVHVVVSGTVGPQPTPFGNFFRFARVTKVEHKPASASTACARCSRGSPRWQIAVLWEAAYSSCSGDVLCEHCICGLVTSGAEQIDFSPAGSR